MDPLAIETKNLRKLYNFETTSCDSLPPTALPIQSSSFHLEEVKVHSSGDEEGEECLAIRNDNPALPGFDLPDVTQHSVFAPDVQYGVTGSDVALNSVSVGRVPQRNPKEKVGNTSKLAIAKEVLGMNEINTKGMTSDEKDRALLHQRWMKAISEEKRLDALEMQIRERGTVAQEAIQPPNFPPKILCIKPFLYHDFAVVPESRRRFVRLNFLNWLATCAVLLLNMIVAIIVVLLPYREGAQQIFKPTQNSILAVLYLSGMPLSFLVWYWPIYSACSTGRHTRHLLSIFGLIIALGFTIFMIIGPKNFAACGLELAIGVSETKLKISIIFILIVLALWCIEGAFLLYSLVTQWVFYRSDVKIQRRLRRHFQNVISV